MPSNQPKIIVVVGPTASGKSALGVELAKKHNGEIISADSRQVYKGLNIGTGKITRKEMRGIPHYLLDIASPKRIYTAADWKRDAERAIQNISRRGKTPIIVGGTGFYIDSLLYDLPIPPAKPDPKLRAELERRSAAELFSRLQKKDPVRAETIDRHNPRRLIRALEIVEATGRPVPQISERKSKYNLLKIGIARPPEELKKRIHARLLARMKQGMAAEAKRLRSEGLSWKRMEDLGLEYRYLSRYLRGLISKEEMLAQLEKEIWHYARRQMTWWRKDKEIRWIKGPAKFAGLSPAKR